MARIRLDLRQIQRKALPPVCIRCGMPANNYYSANYVWYPGPTIALFFLVMFVHWIHIIIPHLRRQATVHIPLCDMHFEHNYQRSRRTNQFVLLVLAIGGVIIAAGIIVATVSYLNGRVTGEGAVDIVLASVAFVAFVCAAGVLLVFLLRAFGRTRAKQITRESITLTGVAEEFVVAAHEHEFTM